METSLTTTLDDTRAVIDRLLPQLPLIGAGVVVFALCYLLGRAAGWLVRRVVGRHDPNLAQIAGGLVSVGIIMPGALLGLWIALPTALFLELFASLGVTGLILGFALKELLENFVAGLLLMWRRPFLIGDEIRCSGYEGVVQEVNVRARVLRSYDGVTIYLPNAKVLTQALENLSTLPAQRTTVALGIHPGAAVYEARQVAQRVPGELPEVLDEPPAVVLLAAVGAYTLELRVLYWTAAPNRLAERQIQSEVTERLYAELTAAGISFPYPTQTVRLEREAVQEAGL